MSGGPSNRSVGTWTDVLVAVRARRQAYLVTPDMVSADYDAASGNVLRAQVAFAPATGPTNEICAVQFYPNPAHTSCEFAPSGNAVRCHAPAPAGSCHVSDPNDVVRCDTLAAAAAAAEYLAAHATVSGACDQLPGFVGAPGVTCAVDGSTNGFQITTSSLDMTFGTGCTWLSPPAPDADPLSCS